MNEIISPEQLAKNVMMMPEAQRAQILSGVVGNVSQCFVPSPGPQTKAYYSPADVLLYGGQAGGGKSALLLGLALTAHRRSLIMRRQYTDLTAIIDEGLKFYGSRDGFNGSSPPSLKTKDGRFIQWGACANPGDEHSWQGQAHGLKCVAGDTPVMMADGSYKAMRDMVVGDMAQTLDGARRVTKVFPIRHDEGVKVHIGNVTQTQSVTHGILTTAGWVSAASLSSSCEPNLFYSFCKSSKLTLSRFLLTAQLRKCRNLGSEQKIKPSRLFADRQSFLAKHASCEQLGAESGCVLSCDEHLGAAPYPLLSSSQDIFLVRLRQSAISLFQPFFLHGGFCARTWSSLQGFLKNCLFALRFYGVRTLQVLGLLTEPVCARLYPLQSLGVEQSSPTYFADVGIGREDTQKYIRSSHKYLHPYKKDIRYSRASLCISEPLKFTPVGKIDLYDIEVEELNHYITANGIVNKNSFDEVTQFQEAQVRYICGWTRSTDPLETRCRVVFASNPPTDTSGDWIIAMFRPWLDMTDPNPAADGDLRWVITDKNGKDVWVADGTPIQDGFTIEGKPNIYTPKSRTFIKSTLSDNPYLVNTDYKSTLDAMPEPYRSAMRDGNFMMARKDDDNQAIPTAWVQASQARWTEKPPEGVPMCAMGVDPAAGGADETILAPRYDGYYPKMIVTPGVETPFPQDVAAKVLRYRRGDATPVVDCGGGYGGGIVRHLQDNGIECKAHKGSEKSTKRSADRLYAFANKRAEVYWKFREALDPSQDGGSPIILPPDAKLLSDLCSVRFTITSRGIQLESKDDMKKRLGRSPDRGDAVVLAWSHGEYASNQKGGVWGESKKKSFPKSIMGHMGQRRIR